MLHDANGSGSGNFACFFFLLGLIITLGLSVSVANAAPVTVGASEVLFYHKSGGVDAAHADPTQALGLHDATNIWDDPATYVSLGDWRRCICGKCYRKGGALIVSMPGTICDLGEDAFELTIWEVGLADGSGRPWWAENGHVAVALLTEDEQDAILARNGLDSIYELASDSDVVTERFVEVGSLPHVGGSSDTTTAYQFDVPIDFNTVMILDDGKRGTSYPVRGLDIDAIEAVADCNGDITVVPEPATLGMLGLGMLALNRKRQKSS